MGLACLLALEGAARANAEQDRKYALSTIGVLRSTDNVDGIFTESVASAYQDYFSRQTRFIVQSLEEAERVFRRSKLPYAQLVGDPQVLKTIARSTRTETFLRTKIKKEGRQYLFQLEWLHAPEIALIAQDSFTLEEPVIGQGEPKLPKISDLNAESRKSLDRLFRKVPWIAQVTGRDRDTVTVNLGRQSGVRAGDLLQVATLDEVKKHPLLNAVVEWKLTPIAKLEVEEIEESIVFCKILEEEQGREVSRFQKITQSFQAPAVRRSTEEGPENDPSVETDPMPHVGWLAGGLWIGGFSRQFSSLNNAAAGRSGGGLLIGPKAESQIWWTSEWFTELQMGYGFYSYSQDYTTTGQPTGVASASGGAFAFKGGFGYSYLVNNTVFGPRAWVKLGYQSLSYSLPASASESTASIGFKGLYLGVGGDLPIRDHWGVILNVDFGLLTGASEAGNASGVSQGATTVSFFTGAYYRLSPQITLRGGFDLYSSSSDFAGSNSINHKIIAFSPAILYYF